MDSFKQCQRFSSYFVFVQQITIFSNTLYNIKEYTAKQKQQGH